MQLPINVQQTIEGYEKETGITVSENATNLIKSAAKLINRCYEDAKNKGTEPCPLNKQEFIQMAKSLFLDKGNAFTDTHNELLEETIDIAIEAYQQGLMENRRKARAC